MASSIQATSCAKYQIETGRNREEVQDAMRSHDDSKINALVQRRIGYVQGYLEGHNFDAKWLQVTLGGVFSVHVKPLLDSTGVCSVTPATSLANVTVTTDGDCLMSSSACRLCEEKFSGLKKFSLQNEAGEVELDQEQVHNIVHHGFYRWKTKDVDPLLLARVLYTSANIPIP